MFDVSKYWKDYWATKDDPQHSNSEGEHYNAIASELKIICSPHTGANVVEFACGNGVLYERMGFDKTCYQGIDFSPAMIANFLETYPDANVHVADVQTFQLPETLDLIFSNGFLQYLSLKKVREHLATAAPKLNSGGQIIHGAVPWRRLRFAYYYGHFSGRRVPFIKTTLVYVLEAMGLRPSLGRWYGLKELQGLAKEFDLTVSFHGSLLYPYRMHVKFTKV